MAVWGVSFPGSVGNEKDAPQPFIQIYALALGKGGSIVMTVIAVIGLTIVHPNFLVMKWSNCWFAGSTQNTSICIVASSRLVFAVAHDSVLPLSGWISRVTSNGQPKNSITVIYVFGAVILCAILPSQVAFTSLMFAGAIPTIAAYGLIPLLHLTMTPNHFQSSHFRLGRFSKSFYVCAMLFNGFVCAVCILLHPSTCVGFWCSYMTRSWSHLSIFLWTPAASILYVCLYPPTLLINHLYNVHHF